MSVRVTATQTGNPDLPAVFDDTSHADVAAFQTDADSHASGLVTVTVLKPDGSSQHLLVQASQLVSVVNI